MRKLGSRWCVGLMLAVAGVSRASGQTTVTAPPASAVSPDTAFAFDLYHRLAAAKGAGGPPNLVFSPFSVRTALAMISAGAAGRTAEQISDVLHLPHGGGGGGAPSTQPVFDHSSEDFTLQSADTVWFAQSLSLNPVFADTLRSSFPAALQPADFSHAPEPARQNVNHWIEQKTHQRIKDLLPPRSVTATTRLILADAVYFKAAWTKSFTAAATRQVPFHTSSGEVAEVPTMHHTFEEAPYAEDAVAQAVQLGYAQGQIAVLLIVPKRAMSGEALEDATTGAEVESLIGQLAAAPVRLAMPRFTTTTEAGLKPILSAMGMPDAFDPARADFSGMFTSPERLCIDAVYHKAFIAVDENGTEAAAATAIGMRPTLARVAAPPRIVTVDRPFLYLIRDVNTGTILFMGTCTDPRG